MKKKKEFKSHRKKKEKENCREFYANQKRKKKHIVRVTTTFFFSFSLKFSKHTIIQMTGFITSQLSISAQNGHHVKIKIRRLEKMKKVSSLEKKKDKLCKYHFKVPTIYIIVLITIQHFYT